MYQPILDAVLLLIIIGTVLISLLFAFKLYQVFKRSSARNARQKSAYASYLNSEKAHNFKLQEWAKMDKSSADYNNTPILLSSDYSNTPTTLSTMVAATMITETTLTDSLSNSDDSE